MTSSESGSDGRARVTRLRLHGIARRFSRQLVLRGVDLDLEGGEIVLLLGSNGAGKTTLLRILSTLLAPTRGTVTASVESAGVLRNVDLFALASWRRDFIGLVSHASLVYDDLTGLENLTTFSGLYGIPAAQGRKRADQLLRDMGLGDAAGKRVSAYSRGMRQRLSIARALLQNPSLVLLDEPFTGLDQGGIRIVCDMLRRLREEGKLVILITHHLGLPPDVIDRAVVLRRGIVARDGNPGEQPLAAWYEEALA
jgi:heme exporter protein A